MSVAITRMIEPYAPEELELAEHRVLITACTTAWNMAVLEQGPDRDRPKVRATLERVRESAERIGGIALLEELKQRKILLFPEDLRFILDTKLQPLASGRRYLTATSLTRDTTVPAEMASTEDIPANGPDGSDEAARSLREMEDDENRCSGILRRLAVDRGE